MALAAIGDGAGDDFGGDGAVLENFLIVVDVVDEGVEGVDALFEAAFDAVPFGRGDDARDQVEGEDAFGAGGIAVDVKRDAELEEEAFGGMFIAEELSGVERLDDFEDQFHVRADTAVALKHFVVEAFRFIRRELHRAPGYQTRQYPWLRNPRAEGKAK